MNKKIFSILVPVTLILLISWTFEPLTALATVPRLPFTEDFTDSALQDADGTNADWSSDEEALILNWRKAQYDAFDPGTTYSDISSDVASTRSIELGDVDGDGDLDVLAGNQNQTNRLYLNNGTSTPFSGVLGSDIGSETDNTMSIKLGDVDGDGDLDVLVGNYNSVNRLYLNNGTAAPFSGVTGTNISSDVRNTFSIVLADLDGDGDLDLATGVQGRNRLYLNNGTAAPFNLVVGSDIGSETDETLEIAVADVDGDGDLDLVAGNYYGINRLYLNNSTADPFSGVVSSNISNDMHSTWTIALADVDGDSDLDLVVGNETHTNRLYLNNGTAAPFSGVSGSEIGSSSGVGATYSIALEDLNGDGDLDLVEGNYVSYIRLFLNNGTAAPFNGVTGTNIGSGAYGSTLSIVLGDVDGDGDLDLVEGNQNQANRLYQNTSSAVSYYNYLPMILK
jgi:hypothetical protein